MTPQCLWWDAKLPKAEGLSSVNSLRANGLCQSDTSESLCDLIISDCLPPPRIPCSVHAEARLLRYISHDMGQHVGAGSFFWCLPYHLLPHSHPSAPRPVSNLQLLSSRALARIYSDSLDRCFVISSIYRHLHVADPCILRNPSPSILTRGALPLLEMSNSCIFL